MFAKDADILNAFDSGGACASHGLVVNYTFLKPEIGDGEADYVFHDWRHMFGGAEYIDKVDARAEFTFAAVCADSRLG